MEILSDSLKGKFVQLEARGKEYEEVNDKNLKKIQKSLKPYRSPLSRQRQCGCLRKRCKNS